MPGMHCISFLIVSEISASFNIFSCVHLRPTTPENWRTERQRYIDNGEVWYVVESAQCTSHKKDELSHKKDK